MRCLGAGGPGGPLMHKGRVERQADAAGRFCRQFCPGSASAAVRRSYPGHCLLQGLRTEGCVQVVSDFLLSEAAEHTSFSRLLILSECVFILCLPLRRSFSGMAVGRP